MLLWGVLIWSLGTVIAPYCAAHSLLLLCFSRTLVGFGEGVAPASATAIMAKNIPKQVRSLAVTTVFGGLDVGSLVGLLIAPPIIFLCGWQGVFYLFGFMGIAWAAGWKFGFMKEPEVSSDSATKEPTPFGAFFKNASFWAIFVVHFVWNWFYYSILAFLPTFFSLGLGLDLAKSSFLAILPYASTVAMTVFAGSIANSWISSGKFSVTTTRKIALSIAFLGPAVCMAAISGILLSGATGLATTAAVVALLSLTFALGAWSRPSLFCSHQDISPKYVF